jgi:hypothetical protein
MFKTFLLTILIFAAAIVANAQFGNLKDAVKKKTEQPKQEKSAQENKTQKTENRTAENSVSSDDLSSNAGGLLDEVLMDYINFNYDNKRIFIEQARAMNLTADNSDVKVTMKIKAADGKSLGTYESNAQAPKRKKSYWMSGFNGIGGTESAINLPGAGDYFLEFSTGGKVFDRFPFSLTPYTGVKGESWFVMDGLWNDHAMIDTSNQFIFNIWMRDMLEGTGKRSSQYGTYSARIVREKDGKVIGVTNHSETTTLAPMRKWTRYKITFAKDKNGSAEIGIYDITAQDGAYFVEFTHDGKIYGKYPFSVQGGKLNGVSEFKGSPLETVGGDYVWLKRMGEK